MTFDTTVPNAGQSPGLFPAQNNTNYARLKTIINADHVFNDTSQSTDGFHRQATMIARAIPVSIPAGANSILYTWIDGNGQAQLRFYNGSTNFQITSGSGVTGVVAVVNFNGTGAIGAQTIRSQFNVTSVMKTATGRYTVNFTTPLPDTNYIIQICGYSDQGTNGISNGSVNGSVPYNTAVQVGSVRIQFNGSGSSLNDVEAGYLVITRI